MAYLNFLGSRCEFNRKIGFETMLQPTFNPQVAKKVFG